MRNILLALSIWAMSLATALAVPAKQKPFVVRQSDGSLITLRLMGDEHFHYLQTSDGIPVVRHTDGTYRYAALADGHLTASTVLAHNAAERSADEAAFVTTQGLQSELLTALRSSRLSQKSAQLSNPRTLGIAPQSVGEGAGATGKRRGLVILVNFKDKSMNSANTREAFEAMMNQEGYAENSNAGSVHDYFYAQSYGQFDLTFDVVGPVTVSRNMSYYGGNDSSGNDTNPATMVYEACRLIDSQVNFSTYDWDNDGEVDQVYVIYAGYSEAAGADEDCIWPHEYWLQYAGLNLTLDGVKINTYGCSSELYGTSGTRMDGIGTACHEFSHCLGLPDLYDTGSGNNFGMDSWSVMDYGCYNGDGFAPCGYTAYERWVSGWLQPTELASACSVNGMKSLDSNAEAYVIYNDANRNECYILENRQQDGWFANDDAHGMLVTHVDYDKTVWEYNSVNNTSSRQRCTIIPADNIKSTATRSGDLFPGSAKATELTDDSTPAARLYNNNADGVKYMSKPITNIAEANGLISFDFMGGRELEAPVLDDPADITETGFTARWQAVEDAETYNLELRHIGGGTAAESVLATENFETWGADLTTDSSVNMADKLDTYTATAGWSGEYLFLGPARLKIGRSASAGELVTPTLPAPYTGSVTVGFTEKIYGRDTGSLIVELRNTSGKVLQSETIAPENASHIVTFTDVADDFCIAFRTSTKRAYLTNLLTVCDGAFTADEISALSGLPALQEQTTLEGITTTSHTFSNLVSGSNYVWRAKAVAAGFVTHWSTLQKVSLTKQSGIESVSANSDEEAEVFNLSGCKLGRGSNQQPGVYLLRTKNGVKKQLVK